MSDAPRKKSPRAPSLALDEALDRAIKVYERERLHPAPTDVVAQHIGYKSANNGSALSALASLRYFGLLERPKEGFLGVAKEVEAYKFAPDEKLKRSLLIGFLKRPALFSDLLEKYQSGLPSDPNLRFELIQRGFSPPSAAFAVGALRRSVDFAGYYDNTADFNEDEVASVSADGEFFDSPIPQLQEAPDVYVPARSQLATISQEVDDATLDRIPVRLPGGRKAWLIIPTPFFDADKARLKAQIDLLLTKEDESK